jgi:hypothetical protein
VRHVWGNAGTGPKVYLQGGLHADEMPGPLALWHLMELLDKAEAEGRLVGEVSVVPLANPIGLLQWLNDKPQGRVELETMRNFNRGYPDLAALAAEGLEGQLGPDAARNTATIRAAFHAALDRVAMHSELDALRVALMRWSHDADIVLDLHCDHVALMHFYASSAKPKVTEALGRATGAALALMEDTSGGNAFDEAHTAPWRALRARFGDRFPIEDPTFSTTLEYRGQRDVSDAIARQDAVNLMAFLGAIGAVTGAPAPVHPPAPQLPLAGAGEAFAPQGGIVSWVSEPGAMVQKGDVLGHVSDPMTRCRMDILAPTTGLMFRRELWPFCLKGQSLAHVAGESVIRQGDLLSD